MHRRCVEEQIESAQETTFVSTEPFFKLAHGLPGSGKSEVLKWLTSYFDVVWDWKEGIHFVKLAFMNSMAANIGGSTIHSWGEVGFVDPLGNFRKARKQGEKDVPTMNTKCASLRWILIDEIEAAGCELLDDLNTSVQQHIPETSQYKGVTQRSGGWHYVRPFAGVNTLFIGDFWQIPPVGQVAIMGNPHSPAALESARAQAGSLKNNGKENTPLLGPHLFNLKFDAISMNQNNSCLIHPQRSRAILELPLFPGSVIE